MAARTVNSISRNVHEVRLTYDSRDDDQWFLLCSDIHLDNPKCNTKLFRKHLDQAKERNASVMIFGDLFCAMQGRNDRRGNKASIKPSQLAGAYFDNIANEAAEFLLPYADNIDLITYGNHETAIIRHNELDLIQRLVYQLNSEKKPEDSRVEFGGYSGWVLIKHLRSSSSQSLRLKYHHGAGGGSPVTKGAIQQQRAAAMYDADIIVQGHIHQRQQTSFMRESITSAGVIRQREQVHLRMPTYKDAWADGAFGWEVEKALGPSPLGAWWLRTYYERDLIAFEFLPAM